MTVGAILSADRIGIASEAEGRVQNKAEALARLSTLLARGLSGRGRTENRGGALVADSEAILRVLMERERSQSTAVGGGVAVPHGSLDSLDAQVGALLICPSPIAFDAIDGEPVSLIFGLLGPKASATLHLKMLARVARTFRRLPVREQLCRAASGIEVLEILDRLERDDGRG